ncbi:MAG: hypothetical protein E7623_02090 [Ruminococcaceae bacterium]|nr:hypothetical protein [Oscillospiraceae bacterium]
MEKEYCIISHTHWDREWYQPYDLFRMRLVDLIDNVLNIFSEDERYVFHMDAQTVVLEDYLEIRPERRDELIKYVKNGQLIVGPWYVQNDFFLSSGESTVRNLIIGTEIAKAFGKCGKVGYCPDQFGIIGQLPQILKGFGINNVVFGRGNRKLYEKDGKTVIGLSPSEFCWEGTDGTRADAVFMNLWYNNAQRFDSDINKAKKLIDHNETLLDRMSKVPFRLLMNGVDHLEAQEDLLPILDKLQEVLGDDRIYQGRLEDYIKRCFDHIRKNKIDVPVCKGEMREGTDSMILQGTLSSRVYLKQANDLCEDILCYRLEPLYEMLDIGGINKKHPRDYLRYLWKELVRNHAHDSICGCSNDAVHRQMEERFFRIRQTAEELIRRGLILASSHRNVHEGDEDYILTLANTCSETRDDVVEAEVLFPEVDGVENFRITDGEGRDIAFDIIGKDRFVLNCYSPINLPGGFWCDRYRIAFAPGEMVPYSFKFLKVSPKEGRADILDAYADKREIENEIYRISVGEDG